MDIKLMCINYKTTQFIKIWTLATKRHTGALCRTSPLRRHVHAPCACSILECWNTRHRFCYKTFINHRVRCSVQHFANMKMQQLFSLNTFTWYTVIFSKSANVVLLVRHRLLLILPLTKLNQLSLTITSTITGHSGFICIFPRTGIT
jgi:hypothetical protein